MYAKALFLFRAYVFEGCVLFGTTRVIQILYVKALFCFVHMYVKAIFCFFISIIIIIIIIIIIMIPILPIIIIRIFTHTSTYKFTW
jgi:hypothetical protein